MRVLRLSYPAHNVIGVEDVFELPRGVGMNREAPAIAADKYTLAEIEAVAATIGWCSSALALHLLQGNLYAVNLLERNRISDTEKIQDFLQSA